MEGSDGKFKKIMVIGNILREDILKRSKIVKEYICLSILVLAGSQAAKIFAEMLPDIFIKCKKQFKFKNSYQQCLDEQKIDLQKKYETNRIDFELFSFIIF